MLRVYMDHGSCSSLIAKFSDEETYMVCVNSLEAYCKENNSTLVESLLEGELTEDAADEEEWSVMEGNYKVKAEQIREWFGNRGYPIEDKIDLTYKVISKNHQEFLFILDDYHNYEGDNVVELYFLNSIYCEIERDFDATDFDWSDINLLTLIPGEDAPAFDYGLMAVDGDCGGGMSDTHDLIILNGEHLDEIEDYLRYQLEWSFLSAKNDQAAMSKFFIENAGKGSKLIDLGVFGHKWHIRTDWRLVELHEELPLNYDARQKFNVIKQGEHKDDNS